MILANQVYPEGNLRTLVDLGMLIFVVVKHSNCGRTTRRKYAEVEISSWGIGTGKSKPTSIPEPPR